MPNVRYYDYGVMRREAERRMYDAQRQAFWERDVPMKRVTPKHSEQTRPEPVPPTDCTQDAQESADMVCAQPECECEEIHNPVQSGIGAEELLISALLILALSEGGNLPLVLALLYLLM